MTNTLNTYLRFAFGTYLAGSLTLAASAQTNTPGNGEMRLKVVERTGKETREIDRIYRTEGMTDEKRDAIVNNLIDSMRATRKSKDSQISVTVEENEQGNSNRIRLRNGRGNRDVNGRVMPAPPAPPRAPRLGYVNPDINIDEPDINIDEDINIVIDDDSTGPGDRRLNREFRIQRRQMDSMGRNMRRMGQELRREMAPMAHRLRRDMRPLADRMNRMNWSFDWPNDGGQQATVRGLDAYPSNPDKHMLNVRFDAPTKGDVLIVVTNPKGKEIARRELNEFSGEFVGQVDLGRKAEGVFFVTVTQNEDGAVRRVVLKKETDEKK